MCPIYPGTRFALFTGAIFFVSLNFPGQSTLSYGFISLQSPAVFSSVALWLKHRLSSLIRIAL